MSGGCIATAQEQLNPHLAPGTDWPGWRGADNGGAVGSSGYELVDAGGDARHLWTNNEELSASELIEEILALVGVPS